MGSESTVRRLMKTIPVVYLIFDVLYLDGRSTMDRYEERRKLPEGLELEGSHWRTPSYHVGDGEAMVEASSEQGLEGVIAKQLGSRYEPGRRSAWLKVKNRPSQDVVVGGWLPGQGRREDRIGSLAVGYYEGDELATRARWAPGSRRVISSGWPNCSRRCAGRRALSRGHGSLRRESYSPSRTWWWRSSSRTGRARTRSVRSPSRASATTRTRKMSCWSAPEARQAPKSAEWDILDDRQLGRSNEYRPNVKGRTQVALARSIWRAQSASGS